MVIQSHKPDHLRVMLIDWRYKCPSESGVVHEINDRTTGYVAVVIIIVGRSVVSQKSCCTNTTIAK